MNQVKDKNASNNQMLIIEKFERVINYLYPIIQRSPRKHGIARDKMLDCLFEQPNLLMQAGKSSQISKIYAADANLALLRFYIRFFRLSLKQITANQEAHALTLVAEVGNLIGAWIRKKKGD